jgi:hypothetical protein
MELNIKICRSLSIQPTKGHTAGGLPNELPFEVEEALKRYTKPSSNDFFAQDQEALRKLELSSI